MTSTNDDSLPAWTSYVVAVLVGVVVTVAVQYLGGGGTKTLKTADATPTGATTAANAAGSSKKKKKRNNKKKGETASTTAAKSPSGQTQPAAAATSAKAKASDANTKAPPATKSPPTTNAGNNTSTQPETTGTNGGAQQPSKKPKKKKAKNTGATNGGANNDNNGKSKKVQPPAAPAPAPFPVAAAPAPAPAAPQWESLPKEEEEVWASVPKKANRKRNKAGAKPKDAAAAAAPKGPASETITVDAKKIGIIIGPKGTTMQALQAATGCKLDVNAPPKDAAKPTATATVVITASTDAGVTSDFGLAKAAIRELERNGYAKILQGEDFSENSISVHPKHLAEIVGSGGKTIKAIQTELDVKVKIPPTDWKPNTPQVGKTPPSVNIGLAGSKDNVKQAKQVIQAIVKDHCHPITHPGLVSEQTHVPPEFFHCVIGRGGSEIKHIKGNYQVEVYMPGNDSDSENVIVVGKRASVDKAIAHIQKLIDLDSEQRAQKYSDEGGLGGEWAGDQMDDLDGW
mmetsp:Transcript_32943/g.80076  ORF Transcript_32943/g.80076 Transcript_32943/m.80076 type:complete len:514 (-) Transcript_32943:172-1713(-)